MARYQFQCINKDCEKFEVAFTETFPMADVGKTELYPKCECCGNTTEKIFAPNGNFALRGWGWFKTAGGYAKGVDVSGNPVSNIIGGDYKG